MSEEKIHSQDRLRKAEEQSTDYLDAHHKHFRGSEELAHEWKHDAASEEPHRKFGTMEMIGAKQPYLS